jgi:hypothetical protein
MSSQAASFKEEKKEETKKEEPFVPLFKFADAGSKKKEQSKQKVTF